MSEPATEAGRRLLEDPISEVFANFTERILDIERQARADLAARIVAAVEGLPVHGASLEPQDLDRAAVLRAIREPSDDRRA